MSQNFSRAWTKIKLIKNITSKKKPIRKYYERKMYNFLTKNVHLKI